MVVVFIESYTASLTLLRSSFAPSGKGNHNGQHKANTCAFRWRGDTKVDRADDQRRPTGLVGIAPTNMLHDGFCSSAFSNLLLGALG